MRNSLALSLIAALSGSTFAEPSTAGTARTGKTNASRPQATQPSEPSEKQQIVIELRHQVGRELNER